LIVLRTIFATACALSASFSTVVLPAQTAGSDSWQVGRDAMVREVIVDQGIENPRVVDAMRATRRHEFLPTAVRDKAYLDMALPIGGGQTITSPFVVARMTEALDPQPSDRVLEIGTGSGYQAAVLSPLVDEVYSIEIVELLARRSARTLRRLDYENVFTKQGDGYLGWPEHAPFDKIIVTCSPQDVPPALVQQLAEGGRIVVPLGERFQQTLYRLRKVDGKLESEPIEPTFFVPMTGQAEDERAPAAGQRRPRLVNGSFERAADSAVPDGWYYVRHAQVAAADDAPAGRQVITFQNETPGEGAQALQALGMDGRWVRRIELSAQVAGRDLKAGQSEEQTPRIELTFYNRGRAPIDRTTLGPWTGTFAWRRESREIVVPRRARLSVLALAMYGGTGELSVDDVRVRIVEEEED
jgi:protein-L-isoaspartate(D-aspartate) O-methyltransferase